MEKALKRPERSSMDGRNRQFQMVFTGILTGLIIIMSFVPFLGFIPLGVINATIIHIPVIIGAVLLGPKRGAFLGLVFGIVSMWKNTMSPNLTSFVFSPFVPIPMLAEEPSFFSRIIKCLIICIFSRVMIGLSAWAVHWFFKHKTKLAPSAANMICGAAGSLTNTILVMGGIYLLYGEAYASAREVNVSLLSKVISGVIMTQGIPEAVVAAILCAAVLGCLKKVWHNI